MYKYKYKSTGSTVKRNPLKKKIALLDIRMLSYLPFK